MSVTTAQRCASVKLNSMSTWGRFAPPLELLARDAAVEGGSVAGSARLYLENISGRRVASRENYKALPDAVVRKRLKKKES